MPVFGARRMEMNLSRRSSRCRVVAVSLLVAASALACGSTDNEASEADNADAGAPRSPTPKQEDDEPEPPEFEPNFDEDVDPPTPDPGDQCIDNDDPGSSEATAMALPDIDDCDSSGAGFGGNPPIVGVMKGAVDVDFYKFTGKDVVGCSVDPFIVSPTSGLEICMFVSCAKGTTNFKGCTGGAEKVSDIGNPGCCVATPGQTKLSFSCGGFTQTNDSANVFIRVKQLADQCTPYQFAYHF